MNFFLNRYWGHAISTDLFHWENLEIALKPTKTGTIFSGCSVVDSGNLTGLARDPAKETLLAIYTLAAYTGEQSQALAYSFDKGNQNDMTRNSMKMNKFRRFFFQV